MKGELELNTSQDVKQIVDRYYTQTGALMHAVKEGDDIEKAAKVAESRFIEGLAQLERLKLSADDRRNFKLVRESFCEIIKAMREMQRGNFEKADKHTQMSGEKAVRYAQIWGNRYE